MDRRGQGTILVRGGLTGTVLAEQGFLEGSGRLGSVALWGEVLPGKGAARPRPKAGEDLVWSKSEQGPAAGAEER